MVTPNYSKSFKHVEGMSAATKLILSPSRIHTLGSTTIRIVEHSSSISEWKLDVYPFDTLYSVKQRISLHHNGDRTWLPNYLFLAEQTDAEDQWKTLEFVWPFSATLADPFSVKGIPDSRLMMGDQRKVIFPKIFSGITLEQLTEGAKEISAIHVWNLSDIVSELNVTDAVFGGFCQLYFPGLTSPLELDVFQKNAALTATEKEIFEVLEKYHEVRDQRFQILETCLKQLQATGPTLYELRSCRFQLAPLSNFESLEILFYETQTSPQIPFMRYFSPNPKTQPILKLASTASGIPLITDTKLLRALLSDQPATELGAVLLLKWPVQHPRVPLGTCWTLRAFEDRSAEILLMAPRKDAPITASVAEAAFRALPHFLNATPWNSVDIPLRLTEFTGVYEYTVANEVRKFSRAELRERADPFMNLFHEEKHVTGESSVISLRWKAVSNFQEETNPIMNYITHVYLRSGSADNENQVLAIAANITKEFGVPPEEAADALKKWILNRQDFVSVHPTDPSKSIPKYSVGALVSLYNTKYAKYYFQVAGVESEMDLTRILSMMEVWVSNTSDVLTPSLKKKEAEKLEAAVAEVEEATQPAIEQPEPVIEYDPTLDMMMLEASAMWDMTMGMNMGESQMSQNAEPNLAAQQQEAQLPQMQIAETAATEESLAIPRDISLPVPIAPDEIMKDKDSLDSIKQLKRVDKDLFDYSDSKEKRVAVYSRSCQRNANRQPNVMNPQSYQKARSFYKESVNWVEVPLSPKDSLAVYLANKTREERMKYANRQKKTEEEVVNMEKRALSLGFPLKNNESVRPIQSEEFEGLLKAQKAKPLWLVVRTGSDLSKPNYYICAEYWCARDDLPLLEAEFKGTLSRAGETKAANTCPFCGGKTIEDARKPGPGQTVLHRGKYGAGVAIYAGFLSGLIHPRKFALPCCFLSPDNITPPQDSEEIPRPLVDLPLLQQEAAQQNAAEAAANAAADAEEVAIGPSQLSLFDVFAIARVRLNYRPDKFKFLTQNPAAGDAYRILEKENKIEVRARRILRAYILEADRFPLELGKVGIPPAAIDTFLGQNRKQYLDTAKYGEINTHPDVQGSAFFRLGLGVTQREPGRMISQLMAFVQFAVGQIVPPVALPLTAEQATSTMFGTQEAEAFHAFQQVNYGSLMTEFADPHRDISEPLFEEWCQKVGMTGANQRAFALHAYKAWHNFRDYVLDETETKDWSIFEHMFATRGLFSHTGVLILRITVDAETGKHVVLHCPRFGVSPRSQQVKPPLLVLYEDPQTRLCEPMIFYHGPEILFGVLDPNSSDFSLLPPELRSAFAGFYADFLNPKEGCGRPSPPLHPWMSELDQGSLPRLGSLLGSLERAHLEAKWLIRDRTFRLVGLAASPSGQEEVFYIPVVDDGEVDISLPTRYDMDSVPRPGLQQLLTFLLGPSGSNKKQGFAETFEGFRPKYLRMQRDSLAALECANGCVLPFKPLPLSGSVPHVAFSALKKAPVTPIDILPGEEDLHVLGPASTSAQAAIRVLTANPEEMLEDAYQHLRLSVGRWMAATQEGAAVRKQIEGLRSARRRLPLFELRKRADLLLFPYVSQFIHSKGDPRTDSTSSMLRRDCLQIQKEGECGGACSWSEGRCLIHAAGTPRYVNPAYVLSARLVDELLRTHAEAMQILNNRVSRLQIPKGTQKSEGQITLAVEGRGDSVLFRELGLEGRLPSKYRRGHTYPEELGMEDVGVDSSQSGLPLTWTGVRHALWAAELSRDPRMLRQVFWMQMFDKPWTAIEDLFVPNIQYQAIADTLGINLLITSQKKGLYELVGWFAPPSLSGKNAAERRFLLFDPEFLPLQFVSRNSWIFLESDLPAPIRSWLDSAPKS